MLWDEKELEYIRANEAELEKLNFLLIILILVILMGARLN